MKRGVELGTGVPAKLQPALKLGPRAAELDRKHQAPPGNLLIHVSSMIL
jgi:hypothetical protein